MILFRAPYKGHTHHRHAIQETKNSNCATLPPNHLQRIIPLFGGRRPAAGGEQLAPSPPSPELPPANGAVERRAFCRCCLVGPPRASRRGERGAAGGMGGGVRALMRRKQVDSDRARPGGSSHQLRKELSVTQLVAIGRDISSSSSCFFFSSSFEL